jgi:hypothetical protein
MRSIRVLLPVVLISLSTVVFAQSDAQKPLDKVAPSEAQKAFDKLKTLAGSWVGPLTTFPQASSVEGKFAQFSLRVTSLGNALVHELSVSGRADHPVTMFYLDGDHLLLTHYCDAGNRPRMAGALSPDGKTLEFDFLDLSGSNHYGHMHHAVFTFIDANHHTEDWTWMGPGDKPTRVHFDLQRTNFGNGSSGN